MKTRFFNGLVCSMAQDNFEARSGEVWIEDERIYYVGPIKATDDVFDKEINLAGNLLMPGFKNAHTHSAMTFLRSYGDDLPLLDWLEQVLPLEAKLKPEDVYWLSKLAILEYLTSGITSNFDMYMPAEPSAKAAVDCGFRTVLCGLVGDKFASVAQTEADYDRFNSYNGLISMQLGFHAEYTSSAKILGELAEVARQKQKPVFCHNSESRREVEECLQRTGKTPTAWIDSFGLYDYGGGGFHCVHMTDEDLSIMRQKKAAVISNPGSNVKLASGVARLVDMLEMGIPVALGTDGPASNNCLDFFREMFLATGLQKLMQDDTSVLPPHEVLKMACVTGAQVMGLHDCDCLAPGKKADLIVIDLDCPNMQPLYNPMKNLVYSGSKLNVNLTMVNGKVLYHKGEYYIGEDPKHIYQKANKVLHRVTRAK